MAFHKKIDPAINATLADFGISTASSTQKQIVSAVKSGAHLMTIAPKLSGKSLATVAASIQLLQAAEGDTPRLLYLVPDDEAARQIESYFKILGASTDLRIIRGSERANILDEKDRIYFGSDVVVATPSRVLQLFKIEGINLISMKMLVLDHAHELLHPRFQSSVYRIAESFVKAQHIVLTTQSSNPVERYAEQFLEHFQLIEGKKALENQVDIIPSEEEK